MHKRLYISECGCYIIEHTAEDGSTQLTFYLSPFCTKHGANEKSSDDEKGYSYTAFAISYIPEGFYPVPTPTFEDEAGG